MPKAHLARILIVGSYLIFTLFPFFSQLQKSHLKKHQLFFQDTTIPVEIQLTSSEDHNGRTVLFTRLFHNKLTYSLNAMFLSVARTIDPVTLYSLSQKPYYGDTTETMLPPFEFPIFLIAVAMLLRKWNKTQKAYVFLVPLTGIAILPVAVLLPYIDVTKTLLLLVTIQLITGLGLYELIVSLVWERSLLSLSY